MSSDAERLWLTLQLSNDPVELADFADAFSGTQEAFHARRRRSAILESEEKFEELFDNYYNLEEKMPKWSAQSCAKMRVDLCNHFLSDYPNYSNVDAVRSMLERAEQEMVASK